jgi:predicted ATPase
VDGGLITYDPVQARAVHHLDELYAELLQYGGPSTTAVASSSSASSAGKSWWQKLTSSGDADEASSNVLETRAPRGLYLHGGVGCGKVGACTVPVAHRPVI